MELQEFVKETLLQITKGVKEAQEEARSYGGVVNPRLVQDATNAQINGEYRPAQNVEFEVGLTESSEDKTKKGIGVLLGGLKGGIDGSDSRTTSSVTKIRFTVPLVLPTDASECSNRVINQTVTVGRTKNNRYYY